MGSVVKFSAVNSKVKALKGKMLKEGHYEKLLQCKDFKSAVSILKEETRYGEFLDKYDVDTLHRGKLEVILARNFTSVYEKFLNYFNSEYRRLLKNLFLRWEIEDLKIIIRGKYLGSSKEEIESKLIAKSSLNTINYDYLLALKDVEEVIEGLKGSRYYRCAKNSAKDISKKGLFKFETNLDFIYFSSIRKELKHLDKENKEVVYSIIGLEADLLNLGWIYRGKFFYNIPAEELFNYTIYDGYKLSKEDLKKLCYASSRWGFYRLLEKTPYSHIYEKDDSISIEKREREFQKKHFSKYFRESKTNVSVIMSYLVLYSIELRDIISIIEQKRYYVDISEGINYVSTT
jgi:V/A-type H+/Na+-transporting ATPase subunit C